MTNKKKFIKTIFWILIPIILIIVFAPLFFKNQIKNYLIQEYNSSQNEFKLEIGDLKPFLLSGSVKIYNIELKNINKNTFSPLSVLTANSVTISNVSFFRLLFRKGLYAGKLEIESPDIIMNRIRKSDSEIARHDSVIKKKPDLFLSKVEIVNPHFSYFSNENDTLPLIKSEHGNIYINDFTLNDLKEGEQFSAKKLWGELENIHYLTKDSLYTINVSRLNLSYTDSLLSVDSLSIVPNFSKKEFGIKAGKQTDRLTIHISKLQSTAFDAKYFTEIQAIRSGLITIESLSVEAYRDKNVRRKIDYPPFLQTLIREVEFPVDIEKMMINKGLVVYEELKEGNEKPGRIAFENIKTEVFNITNQPTDDTLLVKANCALEGKGSMNVKLSFPMGDSSTTYLCEGSLVRLPATSLNSMTPFIVGISFKSGLIDTLQFNFKATPLVATGYASMYYHDLVVEAVDQNDGNSKGGGKKIISFIVNNFVVKKDVPSDRNKNNSANLYYKRDPQRFIFNNSLKTILSGVKKIVTGKND